MRGGKAGEHHVHGIAVLQHLLDDVAIGLHAHHGIFVGEHLLDVGARALQSHVAYVGHGRDASGRDGTTQQPLDGGEQSALTRLHQADGHTLAAGPTHATDPMHIGLRGDRKVVVKNMGQLIDIQTAGSHIGGHQEVGRPRTQPAHDAVALILGEPAVQGLGLIAAAGEHIGEFIHATAGATKDDRRLRILHVQHPLQCGSLGRPRHDVRRLTHLGGLTRRGLVGGDGDALRVAQVFAGECVNARGQRGGEEHRLS